jgi:uncharacterized phage infection (PIP) family protein YhgE
MNTIFEEADLAASRLKKRAFVPSPSTQSQMQQLRQMAASDGTDEQAAAQASQQAQAQGQGGPPMMRIEDLAQMLDQGLQQIMQGLQQIIQSLHLPLRTAELHQLLVERKSPRRMISSFSSSPK